MGQLPDVPILSDFRENNKTFSRRKPPEKKLDSRDFIWYNGSII